MGRKAVITCLRCVDVACALFIALVVLLWLL